MTPLADDVVEQCPAMHGHAFPKDARGRTMRDDSGARAQTSQGPGPRNGENGPRAGDDTVTDSSRIDCCRDREMLPAHNSAGAYNTPRPRHTSPTCSDFHHCLCRMTSLFFLVSLRRLLAAVCNVRAQSQLLIDRGRSKRWMGEQHNHVGNSAQQARQH